MPRAQFEPAASGARARRSVKCAHSTGGFHMAKRLAVFIYGVVSYAIFFATFLYALGFVGNFLVPTTLDGPTRMDFGGALLVDLALVGLFAVQHSLMARP